ncbi:MAG: hypothetical protein FIB07_08915 [Candidatus Methanoperedens sp.]|nr:hypothetical protein [Candidatus Methanoperedens sp.]
MRVRESDNLPGNRGIFHCNRHGEALGNIIGSNVANILWVLGFAAIIKPINIAPEVILIQISFMIILSVLLIIFKKSGYVIDRKEGAIFLGIYIVFVLVSVAFGCSRIKAPFIVLLFMTLLT